MRKNARQNKQATTAEIQGYHVNPNTGRMERSEQYAFLGYTENRFFTSDRFIALNEQFMREDGKPLKGYGLEIELECFSITTSTALAEVLDKIVFSCFPPHLFKMQRDGSLNGGKSSAECITQPMSKEFIRNNYANFKLMFNHHFKNFDISATRTGNCGMHCNISLGCFGRDAKAQETAVRKLYYIINKHYKLMCRLFNRKTDSDSTYYCRPMDYTIAKTMNVHHFLSSHGVCFNLGHYDTGRIELRLVGGQKDFGCFRNTMESIFFLVDAVKTLSWADCDDLKAIFKGCNNYVYDRLSSLVYNDGLISDADLSDIHYNMITERFL